MKICKSKKAQRFANKWQPNDSREGDDLLGSAVAKNGLEAVVCDIALSTCFVSIDRVEAGGRRFTYVYEATTAGLGSIELENWITWSTSPLEERRFNAVDFRHELEFGVTEHLQAGLYLADWSYREDPGANEHGFRYQTSAIELIYNLTNPTTDLLGLALYGEVRAGPEEVELESKVILQKISAVSLSATTRPWRRHGKETGWKREAMDWLSLLG